MNINATLFGQMITFAIFVWFTMRYVWPPLDSVLQERKLKISEGLQAAERGHKELELSRQKATKELKEGREQATAFLEQAHKQAALILEEAKKLAIQERENILETGRAQLHQEFKRAKEELRTQVVTIAMQGAEKILQRAINDDDHKMLFEKICGGE